MRGVKPGQRNTRRPPRDLINDAIRAPKVLLIGVDGEKVGVVSRQEALSYAEKHELDLLKVSDGGDGIPVCRVLDYSKHRYIEQQKQREQRRHSAKQVLKTVQFRPKIAEHDYETKRSHAMEWLSKGMKVQAQVRFRGRENTHPEKGLEILERLISELAEVGKPAGQPNKEGQILTLILNPLNPAKSETRVDQAAA